jgi:catechol 2,3-dioxygenase-like lactoylglutathione lyase family enzyme
MGVRKLDHVGVVVDDLEAATAFFVDLGLEREEPGVVEGEWVDKIIGLHGVRAELVFVRAPGGNGAIELVKFHSPPDDGGADSSAPNRLGIRHLSFLVDDLDTLIERSRSRGLDTVGEVHEYGNIFRLCYLRGPEGIIVELAERIDSNATAR